MIHDDLLIIALFLPTWTPKVGFGPKDPPFDKYPAPPIRCGGKRYLAIGVMDQVTFDSKEGDLVFRGEVQARNFGVFLGKIWEFTWMHWKKMLFGW